MKNTTTSSFGSSGRISHRADKFYKSALYQNINAKISNNKIENKIDEKFINNIFNHTSENMIELPDNSVHLIITSPPYNVSKDYDENLSLNEYTKLLKNVFSECFRVLVDGGRICVNIANVGRKPYIPLTFFVYQIMFEIGFLSRGEIIWDKGASSGVSLAWGSFKSATTAIAALDLKRNFVGYETNEKYFNLCKKKIGENLSKLF